MKKIISIFLLIILCINHLNIIDAAMDLSAGYKNESSSLLKNFPGDEESGPEKENKGKEKIEEQEKYYSKNDTNVTGLFELAGTDKFICFSTKLNIHPYHEDDIQPPKSC